MSLVLPKRWMRQPQFATGIDRSSPYADGLRIVYAPASNAFSNATGNGPIPTQTPALNGIATSKLGRGHNFTAAHSSLRYPASALNTVSSRGLSVLVAMVPSNVTSKVIAISAGAQDALDVTLNTTSTINRFAWYRQSTSSHSSFRGLDTTRLVVGNPYVVVASMADATVGAAFSGAINGIQQSTADINAPVGTQTTVISNPSLNIELLARSTGTESFLGGVYLLALWDRKLSDVEQINLSTNPWQIFQPTPRLIGAVVSAPSITRPNSDVTVTGWTGDPDNTNLYNNIDETSPSDTDFIISPSLGASPGPAIFGLTQSLSTGTYTVRTRARRTGTSGQIRALLLDSSGTTVGTGSWQSLTGSFTTYNLSVTTSGTAARVRLEVQ